MPSLSPDQLDQPKKSKRHEQGWRGNRREFLKFGLKTAGLVAAIATGLTGCTNNQEASGTNQQNKTPESPSEGNTNPEIKAQAQTAKSQVFAKIESYQSDQTEPYPGFHQEFINFREMANNTYPGISLSFREQRKFVEYIGSLPTYEAMMLATAVLDVHHNKRYNHTGVNACNTYALDLTRLVYGLEGTNIIGDRYAAQDYTGSLGAIRKGEAVSLSAANLITLGGGDYELGLRKANQLFPFLDSHNLNEWMQKYGHQQHGWQLASSWDDIKQSLLDGAVVIATSKFKSEELPLSRDGHSFVLYLNPAYPNVIMRTQATHNTQCEILQPPVEEVLNNHQHNMYPDIGVFDFAQSKFGFWIHTR